MPTDAEHAAKVADNTAALTAFGAASNPCWRAVIAFYTALHLVERLAAADGIHNRRHTGHQSRHVWLAGHPRHHVILADYTALRVASEIARYETLPAFQSAFPGDTVERQLVNAFLANIREYVASVLGS